MMRLLLLALVLPACLSNVPVCRGDGRPCSEAVLPNCTDVRDGAAGACGPRGAARVRFDVQAWVSKDGCAAPRW